MKLFENMPAEVEAFIRSTNPWWMNKPGPIIPTYKRWAFSATLKKINSGLAPAVVIRGPRQVGKTTLQLQIINHLLEQNNVSPNHILRVQFDEIPSLRGMKDPVLVITRWFESRILGMTLNEAAIKGMYAYIFFDEVQNLSDWAPQIKTLVDNNSVKVIVTGSSALRIEAGRDSLAGRISQVELGTLLLREIIGLRFEEHFEPFLPDNGLEKLLKRNFWEELQQWGISRSRFRNDGFEAFSKRGGYPLSQAKSDIAWPEIADQLNETVIKRAIQHDLRMGERGLKRDPDLLEEVFRLACRYAGQSPGASIFVPEIKNALHGNIGWQRILAYLKFLDGSLLIKMIHPLELRLKRTKGNSKICLCDHGLRASWLQEIIPIYPAGLDEAPHMRDLSGHIVESVVGYYLSGLSNLDLSHFPERGAEPEVDFVLTIGEHRIPLEIKYRQRIDPHRDTIGLRAFIEKTVYNAPFGILITQNDKCDVPDPRIISLSLSSFLLMR